MLKGLNKLEKGLITFTDNDDIHIFMLKRLFRHNGRVTPAPHHGDFSVSQFPYHLRKMYGVANLCPCHRGYPDTNQIIREIILQSLFSDDLRPLVEEFDFVTGL